MKPECNSTRTQTSKHVKFHQELGPVTHVAMKSKNCKYTNEELLLRILSKDP